jgi:glycerate kinase
MPDRDVPTHHTRAMSSPPIPQRLLIAAGPFGGSLSAGRVAASIARGVLAAGRPEPDLCPFELGALESGGAAATCGADARALLDAVDFDRRMRAARAVVVAWGELEERALAGSVTFEIATRARQGGVPAYAVTAHDRLDAFDARILDLQLVLEARSTRALAAAGRRLAELA